MIDDTVKRTIKNLGENIVQRAEDMPDEPENAISLIKQWEFINGYITSRIEVIQERSKILKIAISN